MVWIAQSFASVLCNQNHVVHDTLYLGNVRLSSWFGHQVHVCFLTALSLRLCLGSAEAVENGHGDESPAGHGGPSPASGER